MQRSICRVVNEGSLVSGYIDLENFSPASFFRDKLKHPPPMTATGVECYVSTITAGDAFYCKYGEESLFIQREHSISGKMSDEKHTINFERYESTVSSDYERGGVYSSMRPIQPWHGSYDGGRDGIEFYSFDIRARAKRAMFTFQNYRFAVLTDSEGNTRKYGDGSIEVLDIILWIPYIVFSQNSYDPKMEVWFHGSLM